MCGKFTQHSSWRDVHAFSQPLTLTGAPDELTVSTPMRFANIIRLNEQGEREVAKLLRNGSRRHLLRQRTRTLCQQPRVPDGLGHRFQVGGVVRRGQVDDPQIQPLGFQSGRVFDDLLVIAVLLQA